MSTFIEAKKIEILKHLSDEDMSRHLQAIVTAVEGGTDEEILQSLYKLSMLFYSAARKAGVALEYDSVTNFIDLFKEKKIEGFQFKLTQPFIEKLAYIQLLLKIAKDKITLEEDFFSFRQSIGSLAFYFFQEAAKAYIFFGNHVKAQEEVDLLQTQTIDARTYTAISNSENPCTYKLVMFDNPYLSKEDGKGEEEFYEVIEYGVMRRIPKEDKKIEEIRPLFQDLIAEKGKKQVDNENFLKEIENKVDQFLKSDRHLQDLYDFDGADFSNKSIEGINCRSIGMKNTNMKNAIISYSKNNPSQSTSFIDADLSGVIADNFKCLFRNLVLEINTKEFVAEFLELYAGFKKAEYFSWNSNFDKKLKKCATDGEQALRIFQHAQEVPAGRTARTLNSLLKQKWEAQLVSQVEKDVESPASPSEGEMVIPVKIISPASPLSKATIVEKIPSDKKDVCKISIQYKFSDGKNDKTLLYSLDTLAFVEAFSENYAMSRQASFFAWNATFDKKLKKNVGNTAEQTLEILRHAQENPKSRTAKVLAIMFRNNFQESLDRQSKARKNVTIASVGSSSGLQDMNISLDDGSVGGDDSVSNHSQQLKL